MTTQVLTREENEEIRINRIIANIEPGDWIKVKFNGKRFNNLKVTGKSTDYISVMEYRVNGVNHFFNLHNKGIDWIETKGADTEYPVGGPFTALLIILYLLV